MKTAAKWAVLLVCVSLVIPAGWSFAKGPSAGEKLFQQHCAACHPNGGNIINAAFTLHKKDREAHGVKTASDIVGKMRNPGPGMTRFDKKAVPDNQAKQIAEYIIKTFK
jgi:cytochrome c6